MCGFNPTEKIHFRENNWLIFWGIWGETELILRIWEAKVKYFEGAEEFSFMDLGRFREQGSTDPYPGGFIIIKANKPFLIAIFVLTSPYSLFSSQF